MEAQISQLLSKYAELNEVQLAPSSDDWAADIWQRTHGHRGLTIVCGVELDALIFHSVQAREAPVQLDRWREYAATELPHAARRRPTVSRIFLDLQRSLQAWDGREQLLELLEMVHPSPYRTICICKSAR